VAFYIDAETAPPSLFPDVALQALGADALNAACHQGQEGMSNAYLSGFSVRQPLFAGCPSDKAPAANTHCRWSLTTSFQIVEVSKRKADFGAETL